MTPRQFFDRLRTLLKEMEWGSSGNKIFGGGVYIVPRLPLHKLQEFSAPCCFIIDTGGPYDPEHPVILYQQFQLIFFIEIIQDNLGQGAMMGASRVANTSQGAGVFEIESEVLSQIVETTALTTKVYVLEKSRTQSQVVRSNNPCVFRMISLQANLLETA
jgi:hypothetical protein